MSTFSKRCTAIQFYNAGYLLFQERRYEHALIDLRKAEEAFLNLDAPGHAFSHALPNGVTGLANTLALIGRCYQQLGDTATALTSFETSLINAKFERQRPFRSFFRTLKEHMISCYAMNLEKIDDRTLHDILTREAAIDTAYRFPFSLSGEAFTIARLYELAPDRYPRFREFSVHAQQQDGLIRRTNKQSDESRMKKASIYIWVLLGSLWAIYSIFMAGTIFSK